MAAWASGTFRGHRAMARALYAPPRQPGSARAGATAQGPSPDLAGLEPATSVRSKRGAPSTSRLSRFVRPLPLRGECSTGTTLA